MNTLPLPEQLRGSWDHALIMTYGLDVPFFERTLLPQFITHCRNKIILANGRHYLDASARYAQKEFQIHHLNQTYIVAGIFGPRDAHAKVILLLNKEQGRLCIGSGNLNQQGYASGGELFTCYEYSTESFEMLSAFLTIRELIDGLIHHNYLQGPVKRYIEYMWEDTPWLLRTPMGNSYPVRHNLTQSFLTQIEQTVNGEVVEDLSILVPFFDKEAIALSHLIETLRPQHTTLLLQPGNASADPAALQRVLERIPGSYEVRPFQIKGEKTYVHAKCYVLKLANRAICLQGSPNLSQVALLLHGSSSNIEVANLLTGERTTFDHLFENLDIGAPVADLANLQLTYHATERADEPPEDSWQLLGGEWNKYGLSLNFHGNLPNLQGAELVIGDKRFPLQVRNIEAQLLDILLPAIATELLTRPTSVAISYSEDKQVYESNRIFVCNRTSLDTILHHSLTDENLKHTPDLDLDDKEVEDLLSKLDQTLIIDERSIWELVGRHPAPGSQKEDTEAHHLNYDDINYDALRRHPKIRQYLESTLNEDRYTRSRLQIILSSITSHLDTLLQADSPSTNSLMNLTATTVEEDEDEAIAETSQTIEEARKRSWTARRRIGRIWKDFIRRYLHGHANPKFQEIVGFEVVTKNYIIFSQILWQLFTKDWVEPSFIIDALIQSWELFWGNWKPDGYFYILDIDQQILAWQLIREYKSDALTLASFFYSAQLATTERWQNQLFSLRDSWRQFLCFSPFSLVPEVLSDAQLRLAPLFPYDPPTPAAIVDQLTRLAHFDTRANFLKQLEASGRFPPGSCSFKKEMLYVEALGGKATIDCLVIQSPVALASKEAATALLQEWVQAETLNYYRIAATKPGEPSVTTHIIYYDVAIKKGKYWDKASGNGAQQISGTIPLPKREGDATLDQLRALAIQIKPT